MELKFMDYNITKISNLFKSHLYGIEITIICIPYSQNVESLNRTFMELKCDSGTANLKRDCLNRTFMELKLFVAPPESAGSLTCLNRTFMELKYHLQLFDD